MFIKSIFKGYPQTWGDVCKLRKIPKIGKLLYKIMQSTCGNITGHVPSKTEWGYSGGEYADTWCRWCNKIGKLKVTELPKSARKIIWEANGCDITKDEWKP